MNELFYTILEMSISASILVLVVLLLRLIFKKAPKWVNVLLWALVAVRLICPFAIESPFSLMPNIDYLAVNEVESYVDMGFDNVPDDIPEYVIGGNPIGEDVPTHTSPTDPVTQINRGFSVELILSFIWLSGISVMLIYMLVSCICVYRRIQKSTQFRDNIYTSNAVTSPFVFGFVKPRIYLPESMDAVNMSYVIAHEEAHLRRRDHWWKPIGFILLAIHWFNPIIWLAYILLCRDIEMACDERVIREMGERERVDYSEALLDCSVSRRIITACPLAFGENNVKERIRTVLNYKKPAFWIVILAVIACAVAAVCFLTNPQHNTEPAEENKLQNDNSPTVETGYPSGEIQIAQIVYDGRIYFYSANGFDNSLPDGFEYVGNITEIDNINGPTKNFHGARVEKGQEIYADESNLDAVYLKYQNGYARFEVIKPTNDTLKNGFENARIKIKHINSNGQLVNVTLGINLPSEWKIHYDYQSYEVIPFAEYADLKNGSDYVGGFGFLTYDLPAEQADIPEAIFNQIAMGAMTFWNIRQDFDVVTDEDSPYRTALTSVLYSSKAFQDGIERSNSAIVSYHPEYKMYIALQLIDGTKDRTILSEEELRYVAESIEWISVEFSDTGAEAVGQSGLFKKTVEFLSKEYHAVYDPYYQILNLAIFDWNESGNEATFRYTVTQQYWNRDPSTVDYIKAAKDDPERYEMMCKDYLAPKEGNFFFKVVLNGDEIELYSNESPTGVEWKPRKIADYLPESSLPITITEVNRDSTSQEENNTDEPILNISNKSDVDTTNSGTDRYLDPNIKPITAERLEYVDSNFIYSIGDSFKHKSFTYAVNNTKIMGDSDLFNKNNIPDSPYFSENGELLDGYVGVILNITVTNNLDIDKELYINTFKICSISDDGKYSNEKRAQICAYLCDKDYHPSTNSKDYYKCVFSPSEKINFDILYIIQKAAVESNLNVVINDYGFSGYADEDVRFIRIN